MANSPVNGVLDEVDGVADEFGDTVRYTASLVRQGKHRFYTLTMPIDVLAATCSVDRRIENPLLGFQRRLNHRRAKEIAQYINSGLGTIPGSIILSAQPEAEFKYSTPNRTISLKQHERQSLSRLISEWQRDPMEIDLDMRRLGLLGDFVAACIFIVALCNTMLARIAERSTAGPRSFVHLGPMAFVNDIEARSNAD